MKKIYLVFTLLFVLLGCGGKTEETSSQNILRIAKDVELASMDTAAVTDNLSFEVMATTKEGLYNLDENGVPVPGIAKSYDLSEDGLTYTFHLREEAKWSNGTPVTAADFVFAWQREINPDTAAGFSFILETAGIKNAGKILNGELGVEELGIKAIDDYTLEVNLERPTPFFLRLTAFAPFFPINEEFYNEQGDNYALEPENILANGPFKMVDWKKGYGFKVMKNESYYAADTVKIDGIDFRIIKDNQTAALKYDNGELDIIKISSELLDKYKNESEYNEYATGYLWYIDINHELEKMQNKNLRKAIALGVDKSYITESILGDGSKVADYIIPANIAMGPDGNDFRSGTPSYTTYDKVEAQKAWELAKAELGQEEIEIELLFEDFETIKKMAEYMQAELTANLPGLTITLKSQPKKNRLALMAEGNYEMALTRWGATYADPQNYLQIFETGNSLNYTRYSDSEYDKLLKEIATGDLTLDANKRWAAMKEAEKIMLSDYAVSPLYQKGFVLLVKDNITGLKSYTSGTEFIYRDIQIK